MTVVEFDGLRPTIDGTAWVAPTATLVGAVTLAEDSSVFYGAVLRADISEIRLEVGSDVQDNAVLHADVDLPTVIGPHARIGHAAVVHGSIVEEGSLIGMNATVLTGCHIGAGSLVAGGAVVLPGTNIPPGSLAAGVPATVKRSLTGDEKASILENTDFYVRLAHRHASTARTTIT